MKHKFLKQVMAVLLAGTILFVGGCGSSGSDSSNADPAGNAEGTNNAEQEENLITGVTVEEQVLAEKDGVKVTLTGLSYESGAYYLDVVVENDTEELYIIRVNDASVNGYVCTLYTSDGFSSGKTEGRLTLRGNVFYYADVIGMGKIGEIKLSGFTLYGAEEEKAEYGTFYQIKEDQYTDPFFTAESVVIETSAYANMEKGVIPEGEILYDQDGILLVKVEDENDPYGLFFLKNDSDKSLKLTTTDMCINDFMAQDPSIGQDMITLSGNYVKNGDVDVSTFMMEPLMLEHIGLEPDEEVTSVECNIAIQMTETEVFEGGGTITSMKNIVEIPYSYTKE